MTDVRPFRGVRFDPSVVGDWGAVLGPPYDIITGEQVEMLRRRHANQIQHIESASGEAGTAEAARVFGDWRRSGVLQQEAAPAYYLAEHEFSHEGAQHSRTSLYAAVRLTPWAAGEVFAHEWTMPGPREERMRLRQTVRADVSPLMALLPDRSGTIAGIMEDAREVAPTATGTDYADERHTLRVLDDPTQVEALRSALAADKVYMADGHHRYEAALAYRDQCAAEAGASWTGEEPENFVLMGLIVAGVQRIRLQIADEASTRCTARCVERALQVPPGRERRQETRQITWASAFFHGCTGKHALSSTEKPHTRQALQFRFTWGAKQAALFFGYTMMFSSITGRMHAG